MTTYYIKEYIEKRIHNAKEMLTKEYGDEIPKEYTDLLELVSKASLHGDLYHRHIKSMLNNIANQYKKLELNDTLTDLFFGDNAITERLNYVRTPQSKNAVFREVKLAELQNRKINLSGWNLKGIHLSYLDITGADLSYANLTGSGFYSIDSKNINFSYSNMYGFRFDFCSVMNSTFFNTKLEASYISGSYLNNSTFTKTSFDRSIHVRSHFMSTTFNESTMHHCRLDSVNFVNAKLNETDFEHSTVNLLPNDPINPDNPYNKGEVDFRRASLSNTNSDRFTKYKISLGNVKDVKSYAEAIHSVDKDKEDPLNRDIHGIIAGHIHQHGDGILKEHINSLEIEESKKSSQSSKKSNNTLPFMNNSRTNKNESKQTPDEQLNM